MKIKKQVLILISFFAFFLATGQNSLKTQSELIDKTDSDEIITVKVLSYNIYSARKMGIQAIADVILKCDPDLVSLQEVERNTETNPMDFTKEIAKLTNMKYYYYAHALDIPSGGDYGNVILSKHPLTETKTYKLEVAPNAKDDIRSFGIAKIEKKNKTFYFSTTHLGYRHNDATRLFQISKILSIVEQLDKPVILAGDINSRRGSAAIPALQNYFTVDCLSDSGPWTVPVGKPTYCCDWIMYAPKDAFRTTSYNVCYWADKESDHYPVLATYQIN